MKKEDIRIRVTPENVNEFIEVLRRNGENVSSIMDPSPWWCVGFMFIKISDGLWRMYSTTLKNKQVTDSPSFNWTPQDLDDFLIKEKYAREFEKDILATHIHERPYFFGLIDPSKPYMEQVMNINLESGHVVKNADGTASSVTLRDDKAVVEMPNGTLRIVDKSNLFKIV